jgi:molybdenum cofactor cytidylyltransferase
MSAAVILAAGEARRAGGPKLVWPVEGRPSVRRVAEAALGAARVGETLLVLGGPWEAQVREAVGGLELKIVPNPDSRLGQAASLKRGLAALAPGRRALIFLLADQPFITSQIIDDLLEFQEKRRASIAAPVYGGRRVNPVVFDLGRWRAEMMELTGDSGGRSLLAAHPGELALWPAEAWPEKCFMDFDTLEEYERLSGE